MKLVLLFILFISILSINSSYSREKSLENSDQGDWRSSGMHMRLIDDLDRPQDGWCLDVVGSGSHIRFDMPLIGHNCKLGLYADEAVIHRDDGTLFFPAYDACVTVMGLNEYVLPKASLMLKRCGHSIPFLNAEKFQKFDNITDDKMRVRGTELCIAMGDVSEKTFDPTHRWRTLYVDVCETLDNSRSQWTFIKP